MSLILSQATCEAVDLSQSAARKLIIQPSIAVFHEIAVYSVSNPHRS